MRNSVPAGAKMVTAMAIFGTLAPFVRQIALPSGELALYRALIAVAVIGLYLAVRKDRLPWAQLKKELPLLFASGAAMGVNWILLFQAYRYTTVSIATLSYYFAPVIVMIVCPILFREKMTLRQVLCFAMSTLGLVLIIGLGAPAAEQAHLKGVLFGLGAAVFYASVVLMNKGIRRAAGLHRTVLQFLAAIVVLVPYVVCAGGFHPGALSGVGWGCLLIVGLVHTGLAYCLYFSALKDLRGQETAILSYVDPLVAVGVSVLVLGEGIGSLQLLGGALILGFTLWNELSSAKEKEI